MWWVVPYYTTTYPKNVKITRTFGCAVVGSTVLHHHPPEIHIFMRTLGVSVPGSSWDSDGFPPALSVLDGRRPTSAAHHHTIT